MKKPYSAHYVSRLQARLSTAEMLRDTHQSALAHCKRVHGATHVALWHLREAVENSDGELHPARMRPFTDMLGAEEGVHAKLSVEMLRTVVLGGLEEAMKDS